MTSPTQSPLLRAEIIKVADAGNSCAGWLVRVEGHSDLGWWFRRSPGRRVRIPYKPRGTYGTEWWGEGMGPDGRTDCVRVGKGAKALAIMRALGWNVTITRARQGGAS